MSKDSQPPELELKSLRLRRLFEQVAEVIEDKERVKRFEEEYGLEGAAVAREAIVNTKRLGDMLGVEWKDIT